MKKYLPFLMVAILAVFASCGKDDDNKTVYTVIFETDGGSPVPTVQRVEEGSMVTAPATNPEKVGYVFSYWYTSGATNAFNFQTPVNSDMTLYAKWQEEATAEYWQVTWNLKGGTWPSEDNHVTQVIKGGTLAEPNPPVKTGSTFDGWYKEELTNIISFPYNISGVTSNFILYARWLATETQMSVYPDTPIAFTYVGGVNQAKKITVNTNQSSWDAVSNQTWCSITKSGNQFTVTASANTLTTSRNATITVSADKAEDVIIDVKQEGAPAADGNLEKAIYNLGWAINVADIYNNQGMKIYSIDGVLNVTYTSNTLLDYIRTIRGYQIVQYRTDTGRRPSILVQSYLFANHDSIADLAYTAESKIRLGTYDFTTNPVNVMAYFGYFSGNSKFTSLDNLKLISNNDAITEELYNKISFEAGCYKMIVYGKNSKGELIGKYVGYSTTGKTYNYWCIDPENPSFGSQSSQHTPYYYL